MNPISFASGIVPGASLQETVIAADAGGFDYVGLWIEPPSITSEALSETKTLLAQTGQNVLDVEVIWLEPGEPDTDHFRLLDIGAELGARNALVVSADPDMAANAAKLRALCAHTDGSGMRVALEFGIFTAVKTLDMALNVVAMCDHPAAAVLVDPIHVHRSGAEPQNIARIDPHLLPYAQFCDAPVPGPDVSDPEAVIADAVDARSQLGEGALPLSAMLNALPKDIPLSIELRSKALRDGYPNFNDRAKVTADMTRRWLAANTAQDGA